VFAQELSRVQKDKVTLHPAKKVRRSISAPMIAGWGGGCKEKTQLKVCF
jgi:hypothetical protein